MNLDHEREPSWYEPIRIVIAVPVGLVRDILSLLRDNGVRRVDLAVVHQGFRSFDELHGTPTDIPRERWKGMGVIVEVREADE